MDGWVAERLDGQAGAERLGQGLGPAQDGLLLDRAVRRVDQREALRLGRARLVVLDVAGDQHLGDLRDAAGDGLGAGAGQDGDALHEALAVAGVAERRQAAALRDASAANAASGIAAGSSPTRPRPRLATSFSTG